jgi:hypothetical protein
MARAALLCLIFVTFVTDAIGTHVGELEFGA